MEPTDVMGPENKAAARRVLANIRGQVIEGYASKRQRGLIKAILLKYVSWENYLPFLYWLTLRYEEEMTKAWAIAFLNWAAKKKFGDEIVLLYDYYLYLQTNN